MPEEEITVNARIRTMPKVKHKQNRASELHVHTLQEDDEKGEKWKMQEEPCENPRVSDPALLREIGYD
jgi:hypothetical protein